MDESSELPEAPNTFYRCPWCGEVFRRYQARCPVCGGSMGQVFSGQYRPRHGRATQWFAWAILVMFLLSVAAGVLLAACSLWLR